MIEDINRRVSETLDICSSIEAFSTAGLALQLEVPTAATASIRGIRVFLRLKRVTIVFMAKP
jgi:hypothetical protein